MSLASKGSSLVVGDYWKTANFAVVPRRSVSSKHDVIILQTMKNLGWKMIRADWAHIWFERVMKK